MPTPVAHTLAGYIVSQFTPKTKHISLSSLVLVLFMANAPDLDFLPGLLVGKPSMYHSGITHSLGFALLFSLVGATLYSLRSRQFLPVFVMCFFAYLSHLFLDFMNPDGRPPYGVPFFWPLSNQYFISPVPLFLGVHHSGSTSNQDFIKSVLSLQNLLGIAYEIIALTPFLFLARWNRNRKVIRERKNRDNQYVEDGTI